MLGVHMKGLFKPNNPNKYKGNIKEIIYRSSWELKLMREFDSDPSVIKWGSETIIVPYRSPVDNKIHRYFVDFIVTKINKEGILETTLIEVKPSKQRKPPKIPKKKTKNYLIESVTYAVNVAKWKAAEEFCKDRKWKFEIKDERDLNIPLWDKKK